MNSPIGWPGGKKNLIKTLLPLLPVHQTYVEPFCGSAKLLFAKEPSKHEVISDTNGDLINFFLVAKYRPSALSEMFETAVGHRDWFKRLRAEDASASDEIYRAFRFAYLNWFSFGAGGETYAGSGASPKKRLRVVADQLSAVSTRLRDVLIECRDFADMVRRYDTPETLFYCDPPYVSFERNGRYRELAPEKLAEMFGLLIQAKGKVLISEQDHPDVLAQVPKGWTVRRVETRYQLSAHTNAMVKLELLISNFSI